MKPIALLMTAAACVAAPASARDAAVEAPIKRMMDAFNKGDIAAVKAEHVAAPTIVDNVAPYVWSGPGAFDRRVADMAKAEAAEGKSDGVVTFAPVVDTQVDGNRAYVVTRSSYRYKERGRPMAESGYTAFVLVKDGGDWKVESWSWASPAAVPEK